MPNSTGRAVQRGFQPSLDLLDWVFPYNLVQSAQATGEVQDWAYRNCSNSTGQQEWYIALCRRFPRNQDQKGRSAFKVVTSGSTILQEGRKQYWGEGEVEQWCNCNKGLSPLCWELCSRHVCQPRCHIELLFAAPGTRAHQASLFMEFCRPEYSRLPFPTPGDLPDPGNEAGSPALQADSLSSEPPGKPMQQTWLF